MARRWALDLALRRYTVPSLFNLDDLTRRRRVDCEALIRHLCHAVPLNEEDIICRVLGRFKMYADAGDTGLSPHLILDGFWEMWVTQAMARLVKPGMTVVDIGANLGYFTLLLCDRVGPEGLVHAFEPNPPIRARLLRSLALNGFAPRTCVWPYVLSDIDDETFQLVVPEGEPKNAHMKKHGYGLGAGSNKATYVEVLAKRLDTLITSSARVDFIKIDAEGAEERIWHGMAGLRANNAALMIMLEFTADRYADPSVFLQAIADDGFAFAAVEPKDGIVELAPKDILGSRPDRDWMLLLRRE